VATAPVTKPFKDTPSRTVYRTAGMAGGDDSTPIKGLIQNEVVVVTLEGTVTSVTPQTRLLDTDAWIPCNAALAAAGSISLYNVLDQLRILTTTGTAVIATILVRRRG